jgi:hypothetical protein
MRTAWGADDVGTVRNTVLVAVSKHFIVLVPRDTTQPFLPSGAMAMSAGVEPVANAGPGLLVASIGVNFPSDV